MRRSALPAVCCAALLVLAGCSGLSSTRTGTATQDGKVVLVGADPDFDVQRLYRQLLTMHGRDLRGAPRFAITVDDPPRAVHGYYPTRFGRLLGFRYESRARASVPALGLGPYPRNGTVCDRKRWLAYHVAGAIQEDVLTDRQLVDVEMARDAVDEGTAAYAAREYVAKHTDCGTVNLSWDRLLVEDAPSVTYAAVKRYAGMRYVAGRVDAVSEVSRVLSSVPLTTEQVLHGRAVDAEPARRLSVATSTSGWQVNNSWGPAWLGFDGQQRMGELFVRVLLARELPAERAAAAAAGWGNDRVVRFQRGGAVGYAWVLRWDRPGDADEFAAAIADYLDARGRKSGARWRVDGTTVAVGRVGPETVVVFAGSGRFVGAAGATGGDGEVTVSVSG